MIKTSRLTLVERVATQVIRDHKIPCLPVCPFSIANACGIVVQGESAGEPGCSGMLLRVGNSFGIMYSTDIENEGFQRFSVAHELGHYFLPDHPEQVLQHGAHVSRAGFISNDPYEREADFFAGALLLPRSLVRPLVSRLPEGMDGLMELAQTCRTSLTSTAIAYAQTSSAAVAVILSDHGGVKFCFMSDAMKRARVGWIGKRQRIPSGSLTEKMARAKTRVDLPVSDDTDLQGWFASDQSHPAREEVLSLRSADELLTVLYSNRLSLADDADEDSEEEADLIERWTPRFHR
jgi:Zn-dependent peptidase ImmA (M78 family)